MNGTGKMLAAYAASSGAMVYSHTNLRAATRTTECVELKTGLGISPAQHGEIMQGQIEDGGYRRHRCLVSLPCNLLYSKVTFIPAAAALLTVEPAHKEKVKRVVELTLRRFDLEGIGGSLSVESNIEEGKGYGSSTADCVAGAIAAADAVGRNLMEQELAELVVEAETASDNFMFPRAVLFAHREGAVLEDFGPKLPEVEILGLDADLDGAVYTLEFPPAVYSARQVQCFHTMVSALRRAIQENDNALLGRVATASSVINQQFLPKPMFREILGLAGHMGALGVSVAHSGTIMSLLFDPADPRLESRISETQKRLEQLGITKVLRFQT
jgi:uncharacterized protein involved in propanediol utilization